MTVQYQSEAQLEDELIKKLQDLNYQKVSIPDEKALMSHFRMILNQRNQDRLNGKELSDREFTEALNVMVGSKTQYEVAQILRGSEVQSKGKIVIHRDDNSDLYLELFDGVDFKNNVYEVTHQMTIKGLHENRFDVMILLNGLPVSHIELKRHGVDFTQAFNQIIRYRNESLPFVKLFKFLQFFVISNGLETRYFANGDGDLNSNFMFFWTDENNKRLNRLNEEFAPTFFAPQRLHSLISKYTIFDHATSSMLIMRPYQIFAVEAILNHAKNKPDENGFIWHTTGSGKTITSFKASQLLRQETNAKKVIFMIDRADLDIQTAKNFASYLPTDLSGQSILERIDNTSQLVKQLNSNDNSLIVTTIQKLNKAVTSPKYNRELENFQTDRVIFIEDEAHRSQFGSMRKEINNWFKNAQHFGFTGTPLFSENVGADGRTTQDIYQNLLHKYLIKDAIRDGSVLGFNVEYLRTFKNNNTVDDEEVEGINTQEVFDNDERQTKVVQHILDHHDRITHQKHYNAIFTVPSTRIALKYYDKFKQLDPNQKIKVTTIFTWDANEADNEEHQKDQDVTSRQGLDHVIEDYNHTYNTKFTTDHFADYFADVSKRMKDYNDQDPQGNIDILIVVNMFLTGFDSKRLSTLYIDKDIQWHSLIQAYSRTNRVADKPKDFGNIIAFRNLKQKTDDAVKLYSQDNGENFFAPQYHELRHAFSKAIDDLHDVTPTTDAVDPLYDQGDDALAGFITAFRQVMRVYNKIKVYDEFTWDEFSSQFTAQDMEDFQGKYYAAYQKYTKDTAKPDKTKASVLDNLNFDIDLLETDKIDVQYIYHLIRSIDLDSKDVQEADLSKIRRLLGNANNEELLSKRDLLLKFLDDVIPNLTSQDNIDEELEKFMEVSRAAAIEGFSKSHEMSADFVNQQIEDANFYGKIDEREVKSYLNTKGLNFKQKREIRNELQTFVAETFAKYSL